MHLGRTIRRALAALIPLGFPLSTSLVVAQGTTAPPVAGQAGAAREFELPSWPPGQKPPDVVLASSPAIQAELKLTAEQKRRLATLARDRDGRSQQLKQEASVVQRQNVFSPLPVQDLESFREQSAGIEEEAQAALNRLLSPAQRNRLFQVSLQLDGPSAFSRPDLLQKLNVDESQAEALRAAVGQAEGTAPPPQAAPPGEEVEDAPRPRRVPRRGDRPASATPATTKAADPRATDAQAAPTVVDPTKDPYFVPIVRVLRRKQWETYLKLRGEPIATATTPAAAPAATPAEATKAVPADAKPDDARPARTRMRTRRAPPGGPG